MCFVLGANIAYYDPADPNHNRDSIIIPAGLLVICLLFFLYGVFFRTGVDWEKVWWKFQRIFTQLDVVCVVSTGLTQNHSNRYSEAVRANSTL